MKKQKKQKLGDDKEKEVINQRKETSVVAMVSTICPTVKCHEVSSFLKVHSSWSSGKQMCNSLYIYP